MLDYAARRPAVATRGSSPNAMLAIISVHVAALAALVSARMELPPRIVSDPIKVDLIHEDDPPPPAPDIQSRTAPSPSRLTRTPAIVPTPVPDLGSAAAPTGTPDLGSLIGPGPGPQADPQPQPAPPLAARLLTPPDELKPPYPRSKLLSEEQAVLRLKLTIDARGRVVAVESIGRADPAFLAVARRHILARWRYRPASENGQAVVSSAVITMHFELDG